jgi:hypothetical protein
MTQYVSDSTVVVSVHGVSALFFAGVPRPLRASLIGAAMAAGVREAGAPAIDLPAPVEDGVTVDDVVAAIHELMAEGDAKLFATNGEPKLNALKAKVGKPVSDALRDEAWAIVKAEG